jgi:Fe-Mn family superoxide dismutase
MGNIDWAAVYKRYQRAWCMRPSESFGATRTTDRMRAGARRAPGRRVREGAHDDPRRTLVRPSRRSPPGPPNCPDRELVVYCVYGHEVGRATAMRLRAAGVHARYLRGGIDGWQAAGRPWWTSPREPMP